MMGTSKDTLENENESEEDYSFDKILEKRVVNGEIKYYLKWRKGSLLDNKQINRNLECPILMDAFEKAPKDKKLLKGNGSIKKKSAQNCTPVVSEVQDGEKKKVHAKISKTSPHLKKLELSEEKLMDKKLKHTEECLHQEFKEENLGNEKPSKQLESTEMPEAILKKPKSVYLQA